LAQEMRVLFVEDATPEAELAVRELKAGGIPCAYRIVDSEEPFRAALREFRPHLILSDFTLPTFDGLTALEIAVKVSPETPFIFLSGTIGEERAIEVLRRGAVDYVLKGNSARLVPAVKRALREVAERRQRRLAERRIRESEERLRDIIDTTQDWIWELNPEGRYVFSSKSVMGILGLAPDALLGSHYADYVHPDDLQAYSDHISRLNSGQRTMSGVVARWRHSDGEYRWLEGNLLALVSGAGRAAGFRGTHRDISERKQHLERIASLTRTLQMQSGINAAVVRIRDRDELLREACRLSLQVGGYHAMIALTSFDGKRAIPWHWTGEALADLIPAGFELGAAEPDLSLVARALRTGEIVVCSDLRNSEPPVFQQRDAVPAGIQSVLILPLIVDGARIGVLVLASSEPDLARDEEVMLLQDVVANLSFALQYRQKEDAAEFLSWFDPLTGLAKRALVCQRIDRMLRNRLELHGAPAVVAFDVMHLSNVNDTFGRHVGDLLLQHVSDRLKQHIEDDKCIGHLGGGTFVLVLPQSQTSVENVTALLENTVFKETFTIEGRAVRVSFKSGIARCPDDGEDGNTLVQKAEAALKLAKDSGEKYLHYQMQMHSDVADRLALEHRLRIALDEHQFTLHYQPQVNIATGRIDSVEALLRWNDPVNGLTLPGGFLQVLESSGLIVPVGDWVLRQAAMDCLRWQRSGVGPVRIAVNVSALQIRRRAFVETVLANAASCAAEGYGLDLEITETSLLQDLEGTNRKLREVRSAGIRVAIDDFGTGYSSLGLLSKLPVDLLKIDRSFISGLPTDRASVTLVSSIIGLASAFNLTAVAEGVEKKPQLEILRQLRCDQSQGYLHSRPVPAKELDNVLGRIRVARPASGQRH